MKTAMKTAMKGHKGYHHAMGKMGYMRGGKVEEGKAPSEQSTTEVYAGEGSNVEKEAKERMKGGRVKKMRGSAMTPYVEGEKGKKRLDRKPRMKGGRVGADKMPYTSAARLSERADSHENYKRGGRAGC